MAHRPHVSPALEVHGKNIPTRLFGLDRDVVRIGRDSGSELVIDEQRVSRSHARIVRLEGAGRSQVTQLFKALQYIESRQYRKAFAEYVAFDTETTDIDEDHPELTPAYVLGAACDGRHGVFLTRDTVKPFFAAHPQAGVILHNAAFDLKVIAPLLRPEIDLYQAVDDNRVWDTMILKRLLSLATAGVVVSVLIVAVVTRWLLDLGWQEALLLGAVLAPTDAAAVFSVLRKLPLPPRLETSSA